MLRFVARRLIETIPVVFGSTIAIFLLLHLLPQDPAQVLAGPDATADVVAAVRTDLGLDQPLPIQYGVWITHVLRGDLGKSIVSKLPVVELISLRLPATLELAAAALILKMVIALPLGIFAAIRRGTRVDWVILIFNGIVLSVPNFWLSILSILLFALVLGWFPPGGFVPLLSDPVGGLKALFLPALTLALPSAAGLARLVRTSMLEVLGEDYVRTARAKGLAPPAVLVRHALRNAMLPIATVLGLSVGRLLGGAVITESIFTWPGVGRLIVDAIVRSDYAVVQGTLLLFVLAFVLVNLITDISYGVLDPRIRLGARGGR